MNRMKRLTGRKILLATVALCAFGIAKAQNAQAAKDTLTLTLDKALTIALDENPTMKVAAEEIALKKVAGKEAWQSLLPEARTNCTRSAVHPNQNGMLRKCSSTYSAQPIRICWKTLL